MWRMIGSFLGSFLVKPFLKWMDRRESRKLGRLEAEVKNLEKAREQTREASAARDRARDAGVQPDAPYRRD